MTQCDSDDVPQCTYEGVSHDVGSYICQSHKCMECKLNDDGKTASWHDTGRTCAPGSDGTPCPPPAPPG